MSRSTTIAALTAMTMISGLFTAGGSIPAQAADTEDANGFVVYDGSQTSPVLIDSSYDGPYDDRDYRQVRRAAQDLRQDVAMVTGAIDDDVVRNLFVDDQQAQATRLANADQSKVPALLTEADGETSPIIVGVIGQSDLVDGIIADGKFDEAAQIADEWEGYAIKTVDAPLPGVDRALVIAGSDARGAIYGIYSMSEQIGVSPWYWYSDVPVEQRTEIVVSDAPVVNDGPDVKYRGIFINDEERAIEWAQAKFPTDKGTPDVNYYRHVYEMMLRVGLNTLWPAMHEGTTSFNAATDTGMYDAGTPINAQQAAEYGVIASSSHAEQMLRSNVEEWRPFYERNKEALDIEGSDYRDAFDYSINKPAVLAYWRERLDANAQFESILPLGLRGVHDGAPAFTANNPYGFDSVLEMLGDVIAEQRAMIDEVYGSVDAVPQIFVPYKEMGDLYNDGLKAHIPDDVTLVWAEDNFGHNRQMPTQSEAARSGGNGIYYHTSYWGSPKSYLWLNSTPMASMVEQFHTAWNSGAGRFWILNVGDIKPGELKVELFTKLAWDVDGYDESNIDTRFLAEQAERDFGLTGADADVLVDALARFDVLESTKRAEFWGTQNPSGVHSARFNGAYSYPFSATSDGDELQRYINEANELVEIVEGVEAELDPASRSAFYQQITHRVRSYRNQAEQIGYFWKNQLYAEQGRYGSTKVYERLSKQARERIRSDEEFWDTISDGKWNEVIGYSHPITYYGGVNEGIVMLTDDRYASVGSPTEGVGANAEGHAEPGSGTLRFNSGSPVDERFFDVFSKNDVEEEWVAETDAEWINLSATSGAVSTEKRITITVDWSRVDRNATGTIEVYNATDGTATGDPVATFTVDADTAAVDLGTPTPQDFGFPGRGDGPSWLRDVDCSAEVDVPGTDKGRGNGPAWFHQVENMCGHAEANGYVAVEAEHFAESATGADGSRWERVEGVAQRGDAMKAVPETAPRVDSDFASAAHLTYRVHFSSTGEFTGTYYRVPTLNEGNTDDGVHRTARTAIGLDDAEPVLLKGCSTTSCGSAWAHNVMRQIEPIEFTVDVAEPGWHDLVVYRSNAAMVFDRIVIETENGAVGDGLVGPVESPNNIAEGAAVQTAKVAPLPAAIENFRVLAPVSVPVGETVGIDGVDNATTVESDNETAASAGLDDGIVSLTGNRVGIATITIATGDDGLAVVTATVEPADGPQLGAYQEDGGLVVIDPSDALEESEYATTIDSNNGTHTWELVRNGLQVVPAGSADAKANWLASDASQASALFNAAPSEQVNGSAAPGTPPQLSFTVDIATEGTYYLFVNSSNPNANADSYHVTVDGAWKYHSSKGATELGFETWYGSTSLNAAALDLTPGQHTISLASREAGFVVNQIALTTDSTPEFSGFQLPSERAPRHG